MWNKRAAVVQMMLAVWLVALLRIPFFRASALVMALVQGLLYLLLCAACRTGSRRWPLLLGVLAALTMWLMDLCDGAMACVYGAQWAAFAWMLLGKRPGHPLPKILLCALVAGLTGVAGSMVALYISRQQLTMGGALLYACRQQLIPMGAALGGGLLARLFHWL
ncbi:MAG: hypothetical protein GX637_03370 [Clostridiales bacterium]|nr:hypothetical protein [Clostridiales bacterium]